MLAEESRYYCMLLSDYDYNLPEELIAQMPADKRENSKMMVLSNRTISHKHFYDIVDLIEPNSLLVMNNTKVLPARLIGHKDTGAKIEVFLLKQYKSDNTNFWQVLIKPSKRIKPDTVIKISDELSVKAIRRLEENLYNGFLPNEYKCEDVITYQWQQNRDHNLQGQFNFYYNLSKNSVSKSSMFLYMVLLLAIGIFGDLLAEVVKMIIRMFI